MTVDPQEDADVLVEEALKEPHLFRVLLHNDDYTTMEFVITILIEVFRKQAEQAAAIMLAVHEQGVGQCGVYTREIAETKVRIVHKRAKKAGFPLKVTLEEIS
ncbi:MAG: ATP-dependent Clp protease adaptor ClpS [Desulfovibrionaceae bacterium]